MDISKLKRQFIREARSSPKKVAVLVLVMAVAVWRIVPLLAGAFSGGDESSQMAVQGQSPAMAPNSAPTPNRSAPPRPSWRELDRRITADPLMQSAQFSHWRNPFDEVSPPPTAGPEIEPAESTPALSAAGLVLSSTAVGMKRRTALINGRIYGEGDMLDLPSASVSVVSIRPRSVLLESDGEQLELTIAERPAGQRIQVRRGQSSARSALHPEG